MNAIDGLLSWCMEQRAFLRKQLEMMESGKMCTSLSGDQVKSDITSETIERIKLSLTDLDALLERSLPKGTLKPMYKSVSHYAGV